VSVNSMCKDGNGYVVYISLYIFAYLVMLRNLKNDP